MKQNLRKQTDALIRALRAETDDVKCRFLAVRLQRLLDRRGIPVDVKRLGVGNYTMERVEEA